MVCVLKKKKSFDRSRQIRKSYTLLIQLRPCSARCNAFKDINTLAKRNDLELSI